MIKKYRIKINGKQYCVEVEGIEAERRAGEEEKEKKTITKEKDPPGRTEEIKSGEKTITAPMPAKVIKVGCKAGERVRKGGLLIVLEAMKMENEILSPAAGVIKEVGVAGGDSVSRGDVLVIFE